MHIQTTPIFSHGENVLMVLKRYTVDTSKLPVAAAQKELGHIIESRPDANATWGYFPELENKDDDYLQCKELGAAMEKIIRQDNALPAEALQLAFVRLATSEPESTFGGFHVDVSPGIAHSWTPGIAADSNILRVLFNVYTKPRKLEFYPYTADELRSSGYGIPATDYKILTFPESLRTETIEIPPMTEDAVYCLQFLSNQVPHAGRTYKEGHFLVSFGGYIPACSGIV